MVLLIVRFLFHGYGYAVLLPAHTFIIVIRALYTYTCSVLCVRSCTCTLAQLRMRRIFFGDQNYNYVIVTDPAFHVDFACGMMC